MSRLCVLFDVACVVCGAGACCVNRCAECVCGVLESHSVQPALLDPQIYCLCVRMFEFFEVSDVHLGTSVHVVMIVCNHGDCHSK